MRFLDNLKKNAKLRLILVLLMGFSLTFSQSDVVAQPQNTCGYYSYNGTLTPSTSWQSTYAYAGNRHMWGFYAVAGQMYSFNNCGGSGDTYFRIYDVNGSMVANRDDNGPYCSGVSASMDWTCSTSGYYYVHFSQYSCGTLNNSQNIQYRSSQGYCTPPALYSHPQSVSTNLYQSVSFSVSATGSGLTYQWYKNGYNIGNYGATYTISSVTQADAGSYYCVVSNNCGSVTSATAVLTVNYSNLPNTCGNPYDRGTIYPANYAQTTTAYASYRNIWSFSATAGLNYNFSAYNNGYEYAYIRVYNQYGSEVAGNYGNYNQYSNVTFNCSSTGTYYVHISRYYCEPLSYQTTLSYSYQSSCVSPTIVYHPQSITRGVGQAAQFSVNASGTGLVYQWYKNNAVISGANTSQYNINYVTTADAGNYYCVVSNSCGTVTSYTASLTVNGGGGTYYTNARVLILWDDSQTNSNTLALHNFLESYGMTVDFSYVSESQWNGTNPSLNGYNAVIHLNGTTYDQEMPTSGQVALTQFVQNGGCFIGDEWNAYEISCNRMMSMTDLILGVRVSGVMGSLTYTAVNGQQGHPALQFVPYQFTFNSGSNIGGKRHNDAITLMYDQQNNTDAVIVRQYGNGRVIYFSHAGNYAYGSSLGTLSDINVQNLYRGAIVWGTGFYGNNLPVITTQPLSQTLNANATLSLSVTATGSNLTYQWYKSNVAISGATSPNFSRTGITTADAGTYYCQVTNTYGTVQSNNAVITVNTNTCVTPQITSQPTSLTAQQNTNAEFSVTATGSSLTYQWYKDSVPLNSNYDTLVIGSNSRILRILSVTANRNGVYNCQVENSCGAVTSNNASLTVQSCVLPVITQQPQNRTVDAYQNTTFSTYATGQNITYQWFKDSAAISGATTRILTLNSVTEANEGIYNCEATNSCGSRSTNDVTLTVNVCDAPNITGNPQDIFIETGRLARLGVSATGSNLTYQWYRNNASISGATSDSLSVGPTQMSDTGVYYCIVSNGCGSDTSTFANLQIGQLYLYVAEMDTAGFYKVTRLNPDGTNRVTLVADDFEILDIAIDGAGNKIYWATENYVRKANLDGSGVDTFLTEAGINDIEFDHASNKLFVYSYGMIFVYDASGTQIDAINIGNSNANQGCAMQVLNGKVYFSSESGFIGRMEFNGASFTDTFIVTDYIPQGMFIDNTNIYWTMNEGFIGSALLNGSNVDNSFVSGLYSPTYLTKLQNDFYVAELIGSTIVKIDESSQTSEITDFSNIRAVKSAIGVPICMQPVIVQQPHPADTTVTFGQAISFDVQVTGTPQFTYQWYKNGQASRISSDYYIQRASISDTGTYFVTVTNRCGTVISNSAHLTVDFRTTTWNGTSWNNGSPDSSANAIIEDLYIVGINNSGLNLTARNLTIAPTGKLTVNTGKTVTVMGNILIRNTARGTGSLITNGVLRCSGTYSIERFVNDGNAPRPHWISIPMPTVPVSNLGTTIRLQQLNSGTGITGSNIANYTSGLQNYSVAAFNSPMKGYEVLLSTALRTITLTGGQFFSGEKVYSLRSGANLIGNPYPSTINWCIPQGWAKTSVTPTIYFLQGERIASYNATTSTGTFGATSKIPATQGFMVICNTATGTIKVNNLAREHQQQATYKSTQQSILKLSAGNEYATGDETVVMFNEQATTNFDNEFDAYKIFESNFALPHLYTTTDDGIPTAMNILPSTDVLPLYFEAGKSGNYTVAATEMKIENVYLEDILTGKFIDLSKENYSFDYSTSDNTHRFNLHFGKKTATDVKKVVATNAVNIYSFEKDVYISNLQGASKIEIFDIMGKNVALQTSENSFTKISLSISGTYVVKVFDKNGVSVQKVIIK